MENTAPGINPIQLTLEAIVPSAYRAYTSARPATWSQFRLAPPLDYFSGPARAIFASRDRELGERLVSALDFMLIDAMRVSQAGEVRFRYAEHLLAPGSTVTPELLDLISIAQHYEYGSIMVDVSTSIDAAAWFATRDWASGEVAGSRGGEPGVIYRIDALAVARALQNHITGPGATPPPAMQALGVFGLADIGERFSFLDRPRAQQGGSLLGMENVVTHFLMQTHGAIEAFPFDHGTVTGGETPLSRDDICPPGDRGVEIFRPSDKFASDSITGAELGEFLSQMDMEPARIRHFCEMRDLGVI